MVRLAKCERCGEVHDQVWSEKRECPTCGSPVIQLEVGMGYPESVRKIMLGGGVALFICALVLLIINILAGGTRTTGWIAFSVFMISVALFGAALVILILISRRAVERESELSRPKKRLRSSGTSKRGVKGGSLSGKMKGKKIPVGRSPVSRLKDLK